MAAAIDKDTPVLPQLASMSWHPGFIKPSFSASLIILNAVRSWVDP